MFILLYPLYPQIRVKEEKADAYKGYGGSGQQPMDTNGGGVDSKQAALQGQGQQQDAPEEGEAQ